MKSQASETIAAIATPIGEGGISVIRISGNDAIRIAQKVFSGKISLESASSHTAHFGRVVNAEGSVVDEVIALLFKRPNSYSGEDVVEISCHGGLFVTKNILELILNNGARHAEPGEFTKRAFLNGKIDLSQAEAVADLIHARSETAHRSSIRQLEGGLSEKIRGCRSQLIDSIGLLELELDFADEGLEFVNKQEFRDKVESTIRDIEGLLETFRGGRIYREGVRVVIVGPPNAGKSSLLNALLSTNRAIVTDAPGTTRDTIEESAIIGGIAFTLIDTAGLRTSKDIVEQEGMRRAEKEANMGDVILFVLDSSESAGFGKESKISDLIKNRGPEPVNWVIALNKRDLPGRPTETIVQTLDPPRGAAYVEVSAKTGIGLVELQNVLVQAAFHGRNQGGESSAIVTNARHFDALKRAKDGLMLALKSLREEESGEFVAVDLRGALDALGEITGEVTTDEILNNIFSRFCIGK